MSNILSAFFGTNQDEDNKEKEDDEEIKTPKGCIFQTGYNYKTRIWEDCSLTMHYDEEYGSECEVYCEPNKCPFKKIIKLLEKKNE